LGLRFAPALALFFGLCVVGGLVAIRTARQRARNTGFGFVREQSLYKARRWMLGTGLLALLGMASVGLWAMAVYRPHALPTPVPTATMTLIPSPTPRPPTSTPTQTPTPTSTALPSVTPTRTAATTPTDTDLPAVLRRSQSTGATPEPGAHLVEATMAAGQRENMPVDPTTVFPRGTRRVYAFLLFDGMSRGVPWTHVWYGEVDGEMREIWGKTESWSREYSRGQIWRYFDCGVGKFELRIYVSERLQQTVPFVVKGD
jgi:hypothetical protein